MRRLLSSLQIRTVRFLAAAVATLLAGLLAFLEISMVAAILAFASGIFTLVASIYGKPKDSCGYDQLRSRAIEYASVGRKLAIYDRDTGLLAYWYMKLRVAEECARAARYQHDLTLLLIEPESDSDTQMTRGQLVAWLQTKLRSTDLAGYLGYGRFVVLVVETEENRASNLRSRLLEENKELKGGMASFPSEGTTFDELQGAAAARLENMIAA